MQLDTLKKGIVMAAVGTLAVFLLACSSQVPVSTAVGGAQVNGENNGAAQEVPIENAQSEVLTDAAEVSDSPGDAPTVGIAEPQAPELVEKSAEPAATETTLAEPVPEPDQKGIGAAQSSAEATGIVVSGSGQASSAPDLATLRLGVQAIEATVSEARNTAAAAMTAVIGSVTGAGVEEVDVQTGYFSIQPRYTGREITRCIDAEGNETQPGKAMAEIEGTTEPEISLMPVAQECFQEYRSVITGYEVSNNVTVLVRDLETVDQVIDEAVDAGGDNIRFNGLSFSLEDTSALQSDARAAAVSDLEEKAAELAELAGVQLGGLLYLGESGGAPPPVFRAEFARAQADFAAGSAVATPISPGEVSISVNVVGQYQISVGE
ncbi:MAG: SIMPL domain-containing protein [Chloroflexota bacterium]|nr:SIMPL domain-containing protein [Chloroflexota bacterium]